MDPLAGPERRRVLRRLAYGDHPEQTGDLHLPGGVVADRAVVLWHGGSFLAEYGRGMMEPLARELARRGVAAYNATYRRLGAGGGVPETFDDALAAVDAVVAELPGLREKPAGIGLSAGAPLALHAAAQGRLSRVVDIAGVAALALAAAAVGPQAGVWRLFGQGPEEAPERWAAFDPMDQTLDVPALVLHGDADDVVPLELSRAYAGHAGAELVVVPGAGHYDLYGLDAPAPPELFAFLGV